MKLLTICLLSSALTLLADSHYEEEANAIRTRTAALVEQGRLRIDQIDAFKNAWAGIAFYGAELSDMASIRITPNSGNEDPALLDLQALLFEKSIVDNLRDRLEIIQPKVDEFFQTVEGSMAQYPDLKALQGDLKIKVLSELADLQKTVRERKALVEENLARWREWQRTVTLQAEVNYQNAVKSRLEVINDIGQVRALFNNLWLKALHHIFSHQFVEAKRVINGFVWFKSLIPLYFSDKITTDDQREFLEDILSEAKEKENQLATYFNLLSLNTHWRLLAEEEGGGEERGDEGRDTFPKDPNEVGGIIEGMDPGSRSHFEYRESNFEGSVIKILDVSKDVCKYDETGNGSAKVTVEGKGFVDFGPNHEPLEKLEFPSGPELQRAVDSNLRATSFRYEGSVPCDPQREKEGRELPEKSDQMGRMIDHAQAQAKNDDDKKGLALVKSEYEKFKNYESLLNQTIQSKITSTKETQNRAQGKVAGLSNKLPSPPSSLNPPSVSTSHILGQLQQIRDAIWNFALSSGRAVSAALEEFIQYQADQAPPVFQAGAKEVLQAGREHHSGTPPVKPPEYSKMTMATRQAILAKAKGLRDGTKVITYSKTNRLGPDSYDCSGFVTSMYVAAGLNIGYPSVKQILALAGPNGPFTESSLDQAESGDLIIWKKKEGKNTYNHVAIYDGIQTVHGEMGPAVISTSDHANAEGRNTIQEILIKDMMGDKKHPIVHVFKWKNEVPGQ